MIREISISLWGDKPIYLQGAIANVQQGRKFYPGWRYVIHVHDRVSAFTVGALRQDGAEVVTHYSDFPQRDGLCWRMEDIFYRDGTLGTLNEPDIIVVRDADSRPSLREATAVREWEESGKALHTIRDHRAHTRPIMGGLWGVRPGKLHELIPNVADQFADYEGYLCTTEADHLYRARSDHYDDQEFLSSLFTQVSREEIMVHDDRQRTGASDKRLIVPPVTPMDFCGQAYSDGIPRWTL